MRGRLGEPEAARDGRPFPFESKEVGASFSKLCVVVVIRPSGIVCMQ
jgi:hypothetical protein